MTAVQTENETIDESEVIEDVATAYAHRMSKPDMVELDGHMRSELSMTPLDLLLHRGTISPEQHDAAVFVMTLRRVINNSLGLSRIRQEYVRLGIPSDASGPAPSMILLQALHGLKPYQRNLIDRLTDSPRSYDDRVSRPLTPLDLAWLHRCATSVKETLDHVKKNIDDFIEIAKRGSREGARIAP